MIEAGLNGGARMLVLNEMKKIVWMAGLNKEVLERTVCCG